MGKTKSTLADEFGLCLFVASAFGLAFALFAFRHGGDLLTTVSIADHDAAAFRIASIAISGLGLLVAVALFSEVRHGQRWVTGYIAVAVALKFATWLIVTHNENRFIAQVLIDGLRVAAGASMLWPLVLLTWLRWLRLEPGNSPTAYVRNLR